MSKVLMLSLASLAAAIALSAVPGQAAPAGLVTPAQNALLHEPQYIDRYNRHRLHHGHVHGNPHRRHLDCRWHGNHEHCQEHSPRRRYHHHGHVHGNPRRTHLDCSGMAITSIVTCIGPTDTGELSDGRRGPQSPLQRRSITPLYGERG